MRESVFSSVLEYLRDLAWAVHSVWRSFITAVPYLFALGELRKEVTEQYPDPISSRTADDLPPRSRGLLYNDIEKCTGCKDCERICPTECIHVESEQGADVGKPWVAVFDIDFSSCIYCGLCVDACLPQSLVHTRQYEGSVYNLTDMVASFGRGHVTAEQRQKWVEQRLLNEDNDEGSPGVVS